MAIDPLVAAKATYILGWVNIIGLFLVLFSCRCALGMKASMSKSKAYMSFYKYHCYYWWVFIISVAAHAILAIIGFGNPF
jgi:hypothetical protein